MSMIRKQRVKLVSGIVLWLLIVFASPVYSAILKDAVLRIDFGANSVENLKGKAVDVTFVDISQTAMRNSNGRGAVFNGKTSSINYKLGENSKLKSKGNITYHI